MYERHEGDDLLSKDPRLKYKWRWSRIAALIPKEELKTWTHFQCSIAYIGEWKLEATQWGVKPVYYEVSIYYNGEHIASMGEEREIEIKTRLEAQIMVEKLLHDWIQEQYQKIINK